MFVRKLRIERVDPQSQSHLVPIAHIDSFAMRNFTGSALFDDTLPIADGLLEAGHRVPIDALQAGMEDWFRRKSYLAPGEHLRITELDQVPGPA